MKIRLATKTDVAPIHAMSQDKFLFTQPEETYSTDEVLNYVQEGKMLVAEDKGKVLGALWFDLIGCLYVVGIVVSPKHRGKGIGQKLLTNVEELSFERGLDVEFQTLEDNTIMQNLAQKNGYKRGATLYSWAKHSPKGNNNQN